MQQIEVNSNLVFQGREKKTLKRYSDFHNLFKYLRQSRVNLSPGSDNLLLKGFYHMLFHMSLLMPLKTHAKSILSSFYLKAVNFSLFVSILREKMISKGPLHIKKNLRFQENDDFFLKNQQSSHTQHLTKKNKHSIRAVD